MEKRLKSGQLAERTHEEEAAFGSQTGFPAITQSGGEGMSDSTIFDFIFIIGLRGHQHKSSPFMDNKSPREQALPIYPQECGKRV